MYRYIHIHRIESDLLLFSIWLCAHYTRPNKRTVCRSELNTMYECVCVVYVQFNDLLNNNKIFDDNETKQNDDEKNYIDFFSFV